MLIKGQDTQEAMGKVPNSHVTNDLPTQSSVLMGGTDGMEGHPLFQWKQRNVYLNFRSIYLWREQIYSLPSSFKPLENTVLP